MFSKIWDDSGWAISGLQFISDDSVSKNIERYPVSVD